LAISPFSQLNSPRQAVSNRGLSFGFLSFVLLAPSGAAAGGSLLNR
jgi:hypothetical protein